MHPPLPNRMQADIHGQQEFEEEGADHGDMPADATEQTGGGMEEEVEDGLEEEEDEDDAAQLQVWIERVGENGVEYITCCGAS